MRQAVQDRFTEIYEKDLWGGYHVTKDGYGSSEEYTRTIRNTLPPLLEKWKIESFLDASCGEYNWQHLMDWGNVRYIGADIVESKINKLKVQYPDKEWLVLDIIDDPLPKVDLWMCRDTIFHFPHEAVKATFQNFIRSEIKYLLITSHPDLSNSDIPIFGDINWISLPKPPFNFPEPLDKIDDTGPGYHIRRDMFLYSREDFSKFEYFVNP